jgi:hypothetical protein
MRTRKSTATILLLLCLVISGCGGQPTVEATARAVVATAQAAQPTLDVQAIAQAAAEAALAAQPTVDVEATVKAMVETILIPQLTVTPSSPANTPTRVSPQLPYYCSPHGVPEPGAKAYSPDGETYAHEVEPKDRGMIGIHNLKGELLKVMDVSQHPDGDFENQLKALAWSPDGKWIAAVFHHGSGGHISVVNIDTGLENQYPIYEYHHCIKFSSDTEIVTVPAGKVLVTR